MTPNPLLQLRGAGQSVWLDDLTRNMIQNGDLERRMRQDGLSGITSNPKTFKKAITSGQSYDDQIRDLVDEGMSDAKGVYEALAVRDVRQAADLLRPVHIDSAGEDGYISLEVSPHLARDIDATIDEAFRLSAEVDRENVLIKIPATPEGIAAIEACLAGGLKVNVTLLFSLESHREIAEAHLRALRTRLNRKEPLKVFSVASFFLSRIDVKVDGLLDGRIAAGIDIEAARRLRGRAATACARVAYSQWKEIFAGSEWREMEAGGAHPQKLLWASTSTKTPGARDVKYVEELIGPDTINTMPEKTLDAFRDHGIVERSLDRSVDRELRVLEDLRDLGIDLEKIGSDLLEEGIRKFVAPFDDLLQALQSKMDRYLR